MKKWTSILFMVLILLQSCRVYHVKPVVIEEAVSSQKRVKIHMNDGEKLKFKKIVLDSNQYYGIKKHGGELTKTLLNMEHIEKIRLHNKTMSVVLGVITTMAIIMVVGVAIALESWSPTITSGSIGGPW